MTLQIVPKRNPHAFEVLPRRWVVERTFSGTLVKQNLAERWQ
jgi:transposase